MGKRLNWFKCQGLLFWLGLLLLLLAVSGCTHAADARNQAVGFTPAGELPATTTPPPTLVPPTATPPVSQTEASQGKAVYNTPVVSPQPTPTLAATQPPPNTTAPGRSVVSPTAELIPLPGLRPTSDRPPDPTPLPPLPTPYNTYSWTLKVPILMYHYISVPPAGADEYRKDLSVDPVQFRAQMEYLANNGFTTIDLYDLSLAITNRQPLPPKPVILTFDDGYLDIYQNAFPILQEFGLKGTFFIITEFIDNGYPDYMSWAMIEEMAAAGQRMESHSKTHPDLREQTHEYLIWQILGSQQTLAAHIGYTPRYFCYPGGHYDEATIAVLKELDFWGAVTTAGGKWHNFEDRYEWTRLRMRFTTSLPDFITMVEPLE